MTIYSYTKQTAWQKNYISRLKTLIFLNKNQSKKEIKKEKFY